jgi:hypothetical protein
VAAYDLVLVPDAPLASALNRRLDRPHFGTFATTPRRLAAGRREAAEDRTAFLELAEMVDDSWKALAYAIGNVLQCWEYHGQADGILKYPAYDDATTRMVVKRLATRESTSQQLTDYTVDGDQSVAVVGLSEFTELERSILPAEYDTFSLLTDDAFDYPTFNIFQSPSAIVDAVVATIGADSADDVAVVLDSGSQYSPLIESALEAAGIPYYGGPGFIDDPDVRALLRLLRVAYRGSETTVSDVAPILAQLGTDIDIEHTEKRLAAIDLPATEWLTDVCATIEARTFGELLGAYEDRADQSLDRLQEELTALGLHDTTITEARVSDLAFYLDTYEVPVDRENEGVLLADAKSAGHVDRSAVFFLGLDEGWTNSAPQRPWVDTEAQFDRYIRRFQRLIQSGDDQYYLVEDTAGGQPVTPCLYFEELLDTEFERFSDLESVRYDRTVDGEGDGFAKTDLEPPVDPRTVETISQTSLNNFVNSPREYLFSRLVDSPDKDYFREGNLFHDFAEFYVNHPEHIDPETLTEVVEVMLAEARPFYPETDRVLRRRRYRIGLETIIEYLDANPPTAPEDLPPAGDPDPNFFASYFDRPVDSPLTERQFRNPDLGVNGKIDLVEGPTALLDYKSGSKKSAYDVCKQAAMDPPNDTVNYQAPAYLAQFRTIQPESELSFSFFHFLETLDEAIVGDADLAETLTTVQYYPQSFDAFVGTRDAYEVLLDGYNDCVATFEDLGFGAYSDLMADLSFPETTDRSELRESDFAAKFTTAVDRATSDDVDAEKGADQAIRALNGVRKRNFFEEDLDEFEAFVDERLAELNRYRAGEDRFPIDGLGGEPNYRRIDHRDMFLEGRQ